MVPVHQGPPVHIIEGERKYVEALGLKGPELRRIFYCGYAINVLHDEDRRRTWTNSQWVERCADISRRFGAGEFAYKCGAAASILLIHSQAGLLPYCARHFLCDGSVANVADLILRMANFTVEDEVVLTSQNLLDWRSSGWPTLTAFCRAYGVVSRRYGV
jgi:hypothetical protein